MSILVPRLAVLGLALAAGTATAAPQTIDLINLRCIPLPPLSASWTTPQCRQVQNGKVFVGDCKCPTGFTLATLSNPSSIRPDTFSPG